MDRIQDERLRCAVVQFREEVDALDDWLVQLKNWFESNLDKYLVEAKRYGHQEAAIDCLETIHRSLRVITAVKQHAQDSSMSGLPTCRHDNSFGNL